MVPMLVSLILSSFRQSHVKKTSALFHKYYGGFSITGIDESHISEKFVGGSGPGGQSVNRSKNNVQIVHIPTGIRVSCHEHRFVYLSKQIWTYV